MQERPYNGNSTALALSGLVSTTVGDHVGIPGVVLLQKCLLCSSKIACESELDIFYKYKLKYS